LVPIFAAFVVLHVLLLGGALVLHAGSTLEVAREVSQGFARDRAQLGGLALLLVFLRAYSIGGSTYTGIEAVSNGIGIMREPRVQTAKRTMVYMAVSLALCAGGILLCYLLLGARPVEGKTLNAVLAENFVALARGRGIPLGGWF